MLPFLSLSIVFLLKCPEKLRRRVLEERGGRRTVPINHIDRSRYCHEVRSSKEQLGVMSSMFLLHR
jgi:hypothetical protein